MSPAERRFVDESVEGHQADELVEEHLGRHRPESPARRVGRAARELIALRRDAGDRTDEPTGAQRRAAACCAYDRGVRRRRQRPVVPPGTLKRRFRPKFHYELIVCGLRGHVLVGTDAERIRPGDSVVVREYGGMRWYRCLRCDAWVPLPLPRR